MKPTTVVQPGEDPQALKMAQKFLLICGILSSLVYIGADLLAALQWEGYSYAAQSVSELMAVGTPTRPFLVLFFTICNVLSTAFGIGLWTWARDNRKRGLSVTGVLQIGYGIASQVSLLFFPLHLKGTAGMTMHFIAAGAMVVFLLSTIGSGAFARGKRFRLYSIGTILISLVFGAWVSLDIAQRAANLPTPWMGIKERINIFAPMVWMLVLAISLLRTEKGRAR